MANIQRMLPTTLKTVFWHTHSSWRWRSGSDFLFVSEKLEACRRKRFGEDIDILLIRRYMQNF